MTFSLQRSRIVLLALLGLTIAALWEQIIQTSVRVGREFPRGYSWSEMLVNYQGGLTRRGLFGEILFRLDDLVSVRFLAPAVVCILSLVTMTWLVVLAFRIGTFAALLFVFSPGTIVFPLYEYVAFARKDVFVFAALMAAAAIAVHAPRRYGLVLLMAVYLLAGFIIEVAWFYFPLAVAMFLGRQGIEASPRWKIATMVAADAYLLACLVVTVIIGVGKRSIVNAILSSWRAKYPDAFGAVVQPWFLTMDFRGALDFVCQTNKSARTGLGYALGFVLSAAPLYLLLDDLKRRAKPGFLIGLWTFCAFLAMVLAFVVGADWGRYTHLFVIHAFVYLVVTREPRPRPAPIPGNELRENLAWIAGAAVILVYATSWQLAHYVLAGRSPIRPGSLEKLLVAL